ncbi:hypothetical protein FFJ24_019725 [Pedobacter sp. KBS0701]|uniref:hypothetical protein n=1 Tax=Pedobacter sp. KBS0701 TaxID=2578106 RepID=UPI00110DCFC5|nr:hypothetical protein [Pedobacter sp. KBS0701]QDW26924.1 hypothetical protein FFJ24_019725 [Pedobacter sp. KBS0701]
MILLEVLIVVFIFIGNSIFALLGWSTIDENASFLRSIHPVFYLLLLFALLKIDVFIKNKFYWGNTLFIIFIIVLFRLLFQQSISTRLVGNLLIPLLFCFFASELIKKERSRSLCAKWFLFLFIIECCLAIYERISHSLIFPYTLYNADDINGMIDGDGYFRSNSLLGHPLTNALCVMIIFLFISISNLSKKWKAGLLLLAFSALLCFNARFAIIITFVGYGIYFLIRNKIRASTMIAMISGGMAILFFVTYFNLGDRLFAQGIQSDDTSILARFDVFEMLNYIDYSLIFKGSGLEFVEVKLGLLHIENWILIMIFDLGLLLTVYYAYMITLLSFSFMAGYNKLDKYYTFFIFIIVATSNNSLASQSPAVCFFIASCLFFPYSLKPIRNNVITKRKYTSLIMERR